MENRFLRTEALIGEDSLKKLENAHVAIFGIGGVGGYVAEALARAGIGEITIVDKDTVDETNINRQIIALSSTIGRDKVEVMRERMLDINPSLKINAYKTFYLPDTADQFVLNKYDYIADAVDTVTAKLELISRAKAQNVSIISAMGAGNKLSPEGFIVSDIYKTTVCPLSRIMRKELKKRGIDSLKVVYSKEESVNTGGITASMPYVPPVMGLIMAGEIIKDLIK